MPAVSRNTLRWESIVAEEAARAGVPFGCLLRLIERESGGVAGRVAAVSSPSGSAAGLCQVTPIALQEYNRLNPSSVVPHAALLGVDAASARLQVRVGAFLWGIGWKRWATFAQNTYERAVLADLQYAQGGKALGQLVEQARSMGYMPTLDGLRTFAPGWGKPEHPFAHAAFVAAGVDETPGPLDSVEPSTLTAVCIGLVAGLGLVLLLIGWLR
jgi:hypothetical protein